MQRDLTSINTAINTISKGLVNIPTNITYIVHNSNSTINLTFLL